MTKARIENVLRRLGAPGVLGIGLLLGCAGFYRNAVLPAEAQARSERLALEQLAARMPQQRPSADGPDKAIRQFYELFPAPAELSDEVAQLHRLARAAGLDLSEAEYRLERRNAGLWAYRATLPVRGTYGQLRQFLSKVLSEMPTASVDALRFERRKAADTRLEAQVRITLHARPPGDLQ
jgi:Tfp pilus assembly protein PilO